MSGVVPWESLAGLRGPAEACTCSDAQLANVGCDCDARQNLPLQCGCGRWLRTNAEIEEKVCASCAGIVDEVVRAGLPWLRPMRK